MMVGCRIRAVVVCYVALRESQCLEKAPCFKAHTQELRNARNANARAHMQVRLSPTKRLCCFSAAALLTYSGKVSRFEETHWPPFSKPTAFSVKTMNCACARICCSRARPSACEPAHTAHIDAGGAAKTGPWSASVYVYVTAFICRDAPYAWIKILTIIITTLRNISSILSNNYENHAHPFMAKIFKAGF